MLKVLSKKGTKFVSICLFFFVFFFFGGGGGGVLLEDSRAIARSFDKSRNLMILFQIRISHVFLFLHLNIHAEFRNR